MFEIELSVANVVSPRADCDNAGRESCDRLPRVCAGSCAGRTIEQLELATAEWVGWYNHRRLHRHCGDVPPVELEAAYYAQHRAQRTA